MMDLESIIWAITPIYLKPTQIMHRICRSTDMSSQAGRESGEPFLDTGMNGSLNFIAENSLVSWKLDLEALGNYLREVMTRHDE